MVNNIGQPDKIIRIVLGVAILIILFTVQLSAAAAIILGILAGIFILTALIGTCPIYLLLGISSKKKHV